MSLILDALRKIELERKTRRQGVVDIRSEVLTYHGNPQPPAKSRLLPVIILTLLLITAAVSFAIYGGDRAAAPAGESMRTAEKTIAANAPPTTAPRVTPSEPLPVQRQAAPALPNPPAAAPQRGEPPRQMTMVKADGDNITISGIAWQDERSLRRAVINGSLVGEGAEISGARVVEIRENRVRFSRDGQIFEVTYSSAPNR